MSAMPLCRYASAAYFIIAAAATLLPLPTRYALLPMLLRSAHYAGACRCVYVATYYYDDIIYEISPLCLMDC